MNLNYYFIIITTILSLFNNILSSELRIIISAGSDSTNVHFVKWDYESKLFPIINEHLYLRFPYGISQYSDVKASIETLIWSYLHYIKAYLKEKEDKWNTMPLYFYLTGEIQLYSLSNRTALLSCIGDYLSNKTINPFIFDPLTSLQLVSSEQEALYTWLAVNYHSIYEQTTSYSSLTSSSKITPKFIPITYGNIDLNRISSHLVFHVSLANTLQHIYYLSLPSIQVPLYPVYSMSYLSFGYNIFEKRYLDFLVSTAMEQYIPNSPMIPSLLDYCFYSGSRLSFETNIPNINVEIYGPSVPAQDAADRCISSLSTFLTSTASSITTTHFSYCKNDLYSKECGLWDMTYQPSLSVLQDEPFVVTGIIPYISLLLHLPSVWTLEDFKQKTRILCGYSLNDVFIYEATVQMSEKDRQDNINLLPNSCLISSYIYLLLLDGYKFKKNQVFMTLRYPGAVDPENTDSYPNIQADSQAEWVWGALLHELSSSLPPSNNSNNQHLSLLFNSLIGMFIFIIGSGIGAILTLFYVKKYYNSSYITESEEIEQIGRPITSTISPTTRTTNPILPLDAPSPISSYSTFNRNSANFQQFFSSAFSNNSNPRYNSISQSNSDI